MILAEIERRKQLQASMKTNPEFEVFVFKNHITSILWAVEPERIISIVKLAKDTWEVTLHNNK